MRLIPAGLTLTAAVLASACGSDSHPLAAADVQAYGALAQQIGSSASAYGGAAAGTTDPTGCASVHASYDRQVHPMVDRMRSMSGAMDGQMQSMGRGGDADLQCGADAMAAELAHHDAVACTSTTSADHAEAARHASAMTSWADHQHARSDEMGAMMGGGPGPMMGGATTMACHRNLDGTFTLGP